MGINLEIEVRCLFVFIALVYCFLDPTAFQITVQRET